VPNADEHGSFDGMLLAHVVEHRPPGAEGNVLQQYLP
jgi:hypothetical protein